MVDKEMEKRETNPKYSLSTIVELAKNGRVSYTSRQVGTDIDNLGYGIQDVCECISLLCQGDFCESIKYPNRPKWLDRYTTHFTTASGQLIRIYIKLRLENSCISVALESFHPENP